MQNIAFSSEFAFTERYCLRVKICLTYLCLQNTVYLGLFVFFLMKQSATRGNVDLEFQKALSNYLDT